MPFKGQRRGRRTSQIVQSVKNAFESRVSLGAGISADFQHAVGVEVGTATKTLGIEVPVGAKVFSIEIWVNVINAAGGTEGDGDWYLATSRSGQTLATFPDPIFSEVGLSERRNQIYHQEAFQFGSNDAGPYKFHRRLKIPRVYQRMRANDNIFIKLNTSIAANAQVACLYKYYQ